MVDSKRDQGHHGQATVSVVAPSVAAGMASRQGVARQSQTDNHGHGGR